MLALLGEAALVDQQAAARLAAQQTVRVHADLRDHEFVVPRQVADEKPELLCTPRVNHGGRRFERAVFRLRQPMKIPTCHRCVVPRRCPKETALPLHKRRKRFGDTLDQRYR